MSTQRKINVDKIDQKSFDRIEETLVTEIIKINDDATEKVNKLLNRLGLKAKMQIVLEQDN